MKWFKHISDSLQDPFIHSLVRQFGGDGYMVFFGVLEIYAREWKDESGWKLVVNRHYMRSILQRFKFDSIGNCLRFIGDSGKWEVEFKGEEVIIYIPKFTQLLDEWSRRKLGSSSGDTPKILNTDIDKDTDKEKENKQTSPLAPPTPPPKKKKKERDLPFILPDYIPEETWEAYLAVRKEKRAAKTDYAFNLVLKELEKIKAKYRHDPLEVLNQSIKSGWTDVYPLKENYTGGKSNGGIRTSRSDPRDKNLQSRTDAEADAITARWEAAEASSGSNPRRNARENDAPDFPSV